MCANCRRTEDVTVAPAGGRKSDSIRRCGLRFGSPVYRNGGYSYGLFFLSGVAVQRDEHLVDPGGVHIDDFEIEIVP